MIPATDVALLLLQTEHFRNLKTGSHRFSPAVNLIHGVNGSGKTSILEAIGYLGLGRSFRQNRHQSVVEHGAGQLVVFGQLLHQDSRGREQIHRLGFSRDLASKETRLRVDGQSVAGLSALASLFPVSVIDPGVFDIIAGGPGRRRQFLDWLVFHVEPSFAQVWQQCQRVISQRNQILRSGRLDDRQLRVWDQQYVTLAGAVDELRRSVFQRFELALKEVLVEVQTSWSEPVAVDYFQGWDARRTLEEVLVSHREQETKAGYTLYGPNRADIRVRFHGRSVAETFSRGQQKTLVILMKLAQARVLASDSKQITFLLDDINAELDAVHRRLLAGKLQDLGSQVFLTTIERPDPAELWPDQQPELKMFHVEHGQLTEE